MSRSGDLARVVKGAGKVAQAFLDAEAPAVAQRLLRLREHGQGPTCSLKDVSYEVAYYVFDSVLVSPPIFLASCGCIISGQSAHLIQIVI